MSHFPGPYRREGTRVQAITHGQWFTLGRADSPRMTAEGNIETAKLWVLAPELVNACEAVESAQRSGDYEMAFALVARVLDLVRK